MGSDFDPQFEVVCATASGLGCVGGPCNQSFGRWCRDDTSLTRGDVIVVIVVGCLVVAGVPAAIAGYYLWRARRTRYSKVLTSNIAMRPAVYLS